MLHNLYRLHVSLAVAVEGRAQAKGPNPAAEGLAGPSLAEPPESCFPLWLVSQRNESREEERSTETARSRAGRALPCSGVPPLKGEPAVNRGEREAPVDSYNRPLKPRPCVLILFLRRPPVCLKRGRTGCFFEISMCCDHLKISL